VIVQYFIDWGYIRSRINAECGDPVRLETLRKDLRRLRLCLCTNGVLLSSARSKWEKELQTSLRELNQDEEGQPIVEWMHLSDELKSFQNVYLERRLILDLDTTVSVDEVLDVREAFLNAACLSDYNLPCAVISNVSCRRGVPDGVEVVSLEDYEESQTEQLRRSWEHVSFSPEDTTASTQLDCYFAAISVGASAYGQLTLYDPFCLCVVLRDRGVRDDWIASVLKFMSFEVRNRFVNSVTLVGKDNVVGKRIRLSRFISSIMDLMTRRNVNRNNALRIGFETRSEGADWHNRYLDCGICVALLPDGMDVFKEGPRGTRIRRNFEILRIPVDSCEFSEVKNMSSNDAYSDVVRLARRGAVDIDIDIEECAPDGQHAKECISLTLYPPKNRAIG